MRIVYIVSRLNNAGPINQTYALIRWMKENHQCIVYTLFSENPEDTRLSSFENLGIAIRFLNIKLDGTILYRISNIKKMLSEDMPNIVHTEGLAADVLMRMLHGDRKWCSTLHNNIYTDYDMGLGTAKALIYRKLHEFCIKKMDKAVCCSYAIKDAYNDCLDRDRLEVVQNGITFEEGIREGIQESVLQQLADSTVLLVIGSLNARKNPLFIINSLCEWLEEHNVKLIFLGEGELFSECKRKAECCNNIFFEGKVSNVCDYLTISDVFISASYSEGLPMAAIEAGCAGNVLLLSDIAQHRELAMYDGQTGIVFFQNDCKTDLVKQLEKTLSDKHDKMKIQSYFRKEFSSERMGQRYNRIYNEMLKEKL